MPLALEWLDLVQFNNSHNSFKTHAYIFLLSICKNWDISQKIGFCSTSRPWNIMQQLNCWWEIPNDVGRCLRYVNSICGTRTNTKNIYMYEEKERKKDRKEGNEIQIVNDSVWRGLWGIYIFILYAFLLLYAVSFILTGYHFCNKKKQI